MLEHNSIPSTENEAPLNLKWLFVMAWRDSRRNRSRLFLFISSIILGIAALVAIYSFEYNLKKDIDDHKINLEKIVASREFVHRLINRKIRNLESDQSKDSTELHLERYTTF